MTVQPADVEPPERRGAAASDWRRDPYFTQPERRPWSELGEDVIRAWGVDERGRPEPEHFEVLGQTGSGKTYLMCTLLQERARRRKSAAVIICTKPADKTILRLGWPITDSWDEVRQEPNVVFWPRTSRMGRARIEYHDAKITDLLHRLWKPDANTIVAFDEIGYVESMSGEARALVQQYWREGRSQGITILAMKQRPQGVLRDMHSETPWKAAFQPEDRADLERFAELFGSRQDWMPVIQGLNADKREFLIRHSKMREAYISWVDTELKPVKAPKRVPRWMRRNASDT
jgi:nucleoside-triphosphatase THEP1